MGQGVQVPDRADGDGKIGQPLRPECTEPLPLAVYHGVRCTSGVEALVPS